jgi:hypothetical protein
LIQNVKSVESTVANGLTELTDDPRISKGSKYRKTAYKYPRTVEGDQFGQASPELLTEVNSFTHPYPSAGVYVALHWAYDLLNQMDNGLRLLKLIY